MLKLVRGQYITACEWPVYSHLSEANKLWHIQSVTACERPRISCAQEDSYSVHTDIVLASVFYSPWAHSGLCRANHQLVRGSNPVRYTSIGEYVYYWLIHLEVSN